MTSRPDDVTAAPGEVLKASDELRVVWGWASVVTKAGKDVLDLQNDLLDELEVQKAAHDFIAHRSGKVMHRGEPVAEIVESVVLTQDLQKALGVDAGLTGWLIGMKILDDDVWQQVKKGNLPMFSIGGKGIRVEV